MRSMLTGMNAGVKGSMRILKNVQDELYTSRSEETRDALPMSQHLIEADTT